MPRLDRLLTLRCFSPLRNRGGDVGTMIPILMYHSISDRDERGVHPYYRTCTPPHIFAQQMSWLREHGYTVINLAAATGLLSGEGSSGGGGVKHGKRCVITFDDGFTDFHDAAFPVLAREGFTATVFLPTFFIRDEAAAIGDATFLSWSRVSALVKAGITFGSHTVSHKHLAGLSRSRQVQELRESKQTIEDRTGGPVPHFSFPYAYPENDKDFTGFIRGALRDCGYSCAVTTRIGTAARGDDLFSLKRIPVNGCDDPAFLEAKLTGGYDWLHAAQYAAKSVRGILGAGRRKRKNVAP